MRALLTLPEGEAPAPGWPLILAIHDAFGWSDDIRRIARRFAESSNFCGKHFWRNGAVRGRFALRPLCPES